MSKIWIFVEGFSEKSFVINLFRKNLCGTHRLFFSPIDFVKETNDDLINCCLWNCKDVDRIPHIINHYYYLIQMSDCDKIIIICDVEKLKCYSGRKTAIENILSDDVDMDLLHYSFSNSKIEDNYWTCPENIAGVLKKYIRRILLLRY